MRKLLLCTIMALGAVEAQSQDCHHEWEEAQELGEQLVNQFWRDVKHQHVSAYSELIAKRFQGLNTAGRYNRNQQIAGLQSLTVTEFDLRRIKVSNFGDTLVISYNLVAEGEGIVSGPSLDTWHKSSCDGEWLLVSHAYVPFEVE